MIPSLSVDRKAGEVTPKNLLQHKEATLYADIDPNDCVEGKQYHDCSWDYQRPDVLDLKANKRRRGPPVTVYIHDPA